MSKEDERWSWVLVRVMGTVAALGALRLAAEHGRPSDPMWSLATATAEPGTDNKESAAVTVKPPPAMETEPAATAAAPQRIRKRDRLKRLFDDKLSAATKAKAAPAGTYEPFVPKLTPDGKISLDDAEKAAELLGLAERRYVQEVQKGGLFKTKDQKALEDLERQMVRDAAVQLKQQSRLKKWQNFGLIIASVILTGFVINQILFHQLEGMKSAFELNQYQHDQVGRELANVEKIMRYEQTMGREPMMSRAEMTEKLKELAEELEEEAMTEKLQIYANQITDLIVGVLVVLGIAYKRKAVVKFWDDISNQWLTINNTTQAFTLLLFSDILVGYHSADGWDTLLELLAEHWGVPGGEGFETFASLFVATVPVALDVAFKFWVFRELRRLSPSTQAILEEID